MLIQTPSTMELDFDTTYKKSALSFRVPDLLLLGGGPGNCSDRVLKAVASQCLTPVCKEMYQMMDEVKEMAKYVFQTRNELTLAGQTSGSGANETILTNLLDPGDRLVVAIGGFWAEQVVDMAQRYNYETLALRKAPCEIFTLEELEAAVVKHKADMLFVTQGESSAGTLQNLEGIGEMCHRHGCLFAVDAVVSLGVDPLFVDRWQIDAVSSGSQKGLAAPAGLCLLSFGPRAEERMKTKTTLPPYYFDMERLGRYWNCGGRPRQYHYTLSSNLVAALREGLAQICEEGLLSVWKRHQTNNRQLWKTLDKLGLECLVEKEEERFSGITCVKIPKGINETKFLNYIFANYGIDIKQGLGPSGNKAFRVGLMAENSRPEVVEYLGKALKDALTYFDR